MTTALQEDFKSYVFEDVKENLDEWNSISRYGYADTEDKRKLRTKIIEMRRLFAKENGLKTVTQLCPKPSDLTHPVRQFMDEYILRERARITEEYKPLAIAKVVNDEELIEELKSELTKNFSEYVFYKRSTDTLYTVHSELRCALEVYYDEIRPTLSNPARCMHPAFHDLANELLTSLFTLQLVLKADNSEEFKNVA